MTDSAGQPDGNTGSVPGARRDHLRSLLRPSSIAIVGASVRPGYGLRLIENLRAINYPGSIYPVNPRYSEVAGLECFPSLSALPPGIDAVGLAIPAANVEAVVMQAAALEIRNIVVFASSFGEGNRTEDAEAAHRIASLAIAGGLNVVGPNCLGVINYRDRSCLWVDAIPAGHAGATEGIALISQSGGLAEAFMAPDRRLPITHVVSCGNQLDVTAADAINLLVAEQGVRCIMMILEGIPDVPAFRTAALHAADRHVPIAVFKVGNTPKGQSATVAHTGTFAAERYLYSALFDELGVIEANDLDELMAIGQFLGRGGTIRASSIAGLAGSGGECGVLADAATEAGLALPDLTDPVRQRLVDLLPAYANVGNPLDVTAVLWDRPDGYRVAASELSSLPDVGVCVAVTSSPSKQGLDSPHGWSAIVRSLGAAARTIDMPIVCVTPVSGMSGEGIDAIAAQHLIPLAGIVPSMRALGAIARYDQRRFGSAETRDEQDPVVAVVHARDVLPAGTRGTIAEGTAKELLARYGIAVPRGGETNDADAAVALAQSVGFPVVMKIQDDGLFHKAQAGGVALDIRTPEDVRSTHQHLMSLSIDGQQPSMGRRIRVETMVHSQLELFVGGHRDDRFGPVLMVGVGGVNVELIDDVARGLLPLSTTQVGALLRTLRNWDRISSSLRAGGSDLRSLTSTVRTIGQLLVDLPEICQLDVNPIVFDTDRGRWTALDALAVCRDPASDVMASGPM